MKRELKIKYYVRYMDDFILLLDNKDECKEIKNKLVNFLGNYLHIELNSKSRYYPSKMGVNFCGYRTFCTHRLLRTSSKIKIKKKVKCWNKLYHSNKLDFHSALQSLNAWIGHSSHCNSYHLQKKILRKCDFLIWQ